MIWLTKFFFTDLASKNVLIIIIFILARKKTDDNFT